tara:strand:- start:5071 stop:5448 length:378 start_codon:yes stop_codon:yes gene_type:complete
MPKILILYAAINGFLAVTLGAFAAHGLETIIAADLLETFVTAVDYHMYHSLALLATAVLGLQFPQEKLLRLAGILFLLGILFFSGSLYLLALSGARWLGAITPIGGIFFLAAWANLFWFAYKLKS